MQRLELCYVWYAWTVGFAILIFGADVPGQIWWACGYFAVFLPAWALSRSGSLALRLTAACILTPMAFTALGAVLPDLVPEAVHWDVHRIDRSLGGEEVRDLLSDPVPWLVEVAQVCYALFYFLPIFLGLALLRQGRADDAIRVTELSVGALLLSYLGYLVFPTLPPYRFVSYAEALSGGPSFDALHRLLYELEPVREDCMPSGHTMLTVLVLFASWRLDRRQLWYLLPIAIPLLLATVMLRYHWWVDILAGCVAAVLAGLLFWRAPSDATARAVAA